MICTKCKEEKILEDFPFKYKEKGIRTKICKICQRHYKNIHYSRNKESYFIRNKETKQRLRHILEEAKKEGCTMCIENFKPCLEFHHLNGKDKLSTVAHLISRGSEKLLLEEIAKCVLLCANCHRKVHYDKNFNLKMLDKISTVQK